MIFRKYPLQIEDFPNLLLILMKEGPPQLLDGKLNAIVCIHHYAKNQIK